MIQSTFSLTERRFEGLHVGIIMDGNGRWAVARGKARVFGHRAGADAVRRTVEAAPDLGIGTLTLYAFSSDNWRRPTREVTALMRLLRAYLRSETTRCIKNGVRVSVIGRRDRLSPIIINEIEAAEWATRAGNRLHLRIAIDYSGRDAILAAIEKLPAALSTSTNSQPKVIDRDILKAQFISLLNNGTGAPDVDLIIRTSGEQRISDFLIWEAAYAELYFTRRLWPDFDAEDLATAIREFNARDRRFGGLAQAVQAS